MSKKTIYISGPITGMPDNNFKEFAIAQECIEAMGYHVLNPHEICQFIDPKLYENAELFWEACMRECLSKMMYAHKIVTLKNWENSKGACIEVDVARQTGFIEIESIITFLKKSEQSVLSENAN